MSKKNIKHKAPSQRFFKSSFWSFISSSGVLALLSLPFLFSVYLIYYAIRSDQQFIPFSMFALIAGLIYESYRITKSYEQILIYSLISYVISLLAFLPDKNEISYSFDTHFKIWIFFYLFTYLLIFIFQHDKKTTATIGEGTSFLFYMAFVYWLYEHHLLNVDHLLIQILTALILVYSFFAMIHAFSTIPHRAMSRFVLSVATSIVIFTLCLNHIFQLYAQGDLSLERTLSQNLILCIQHFLLGTSAIYLFQNMMLLLAFLPNKYSSSYIQDLKDTAQNHIDRFSESHISLIQAFICFGISIMAYTLNIFLKVLHPNTIIWLVIFICPMIVQYFDKAEAYELPVIKKSKINSNRNKKRKKRK